MRKRPCEHGSPTVNGCSACATVRATAWNRANRARRRAICARHLLRKDGVPVEELARLPALLQKTECQTCGSTERLCVDHDHATKRLRGVLCNPCNRLLGGLENGSKYAPGPNHPLRPILLKYLEETR